jgi:hypothetical protein
LPIGDTKAGFFADRKGHPQPNGTVVHAGYFCGFGQISQVPAADQWKGQWGANASAARLNAADTSPYIFTPESLKWQPTPPGKKDPHTELTPFRPISLEIHPSGRHVGRVGELKFPTADRVRQERGVWGAMEGNDEVFTRPPFGEKFGLFVLQGNAQFRNVRLVRMSD